MKSNNYWVKFEEGAVYHVYSRSINKERIFKTDRNFHFFLKRFKELLSPFFKVFAYCLMSTYFHFCISPKPISNVIIELIKSQNTQKTYKYLHHEISYNDFLESQFKRMLSSYALAFNKQEKRNGSLFQKRFKRILIKDKFRAQQLITYIHHNPIHHLEALDYHL